MLGFSDPRQTLVSLHDMLTGWQSIRDRRRMRHADYPAPESGPPAASMHTAPVTAASPMPGSAVIGYRKMGDRIVPIYGDPTEAPQRAANATQPSREAGVPTPPSAATAQGDAPLAAPPEVTPPPPPDFTPAAVAASAPPRAASTPPVLDLPPPTPPLIVRTDDQAAMLERILAEHRVELARQTEAQHAQHAAVLHAILAQHRLAQAEADAQHRQQLADLLAQQDERQGTSEAMQEHRLAVVQLREVLAEQASAQHAEHVRIGDKIEAITDMVGMVGETVHHIAAAAFPPPPSPPEPEPHPAAEPTTSAPPTVGAPTAAPADLRVRPATTAAQTGAEPSPTTASACASASLRSRDFGPATPSHANVTTPSVMTPAQRRAEQEAHERRRVHDAIASDDEDTTSLDEAPHG
jgi:hypothetical protein